MAFDVYQAVTDRILEMLDKGTVPWRHPIRNAGGGWPKNIESGKTYRGVNVFLLSVTSWLKGYGSCKPCPTGRATSSSEWSTVKVPNEAPKAADRTRQDGISGVTYHTELHELLAVPEIAYLFGRADPQCRQLILRADALPIVLQRVFYDLHTVFRRLP